jgi:hypothetical protein
VPIRNVVVVVSVIVMCHSLSSDVCIAPVPSSCTIGVTFDSRSDPARMSGGI